MQESRTRETEKAYVDQRIIVSVIVTVNVLFALAIVFVFVGVRLVSFSGVAFASDFGVDASLFDTENQRVRYQYDDQGSSLRSSG
jgi:hypothetical protein